jgi:hypothetical protein
MGCLQDNDLVSQSLKAVRSSRSGARSGLRPGERFCSGKKVGARNVTIVRTPWQCQSRSP